MADEKRDGWVKLDIIAKAIAGILLPIIILIVGNLLTTQQQKANEARLQQQKEADRARLDQQREADQAQHNADRVSVYLNHLASTNPNERKLALQAMAYLADNNQFPKELVGAVIASLDDKDKEVASVGTETLTQAAKSDPQIAQEIVKSAKNNPNKANAITKAAQSSPDLKTTIEKVDRSLFDSLVTFLVSVYDEQTGQPISGASVICSGSSQGSESGSIGRTDTSGKSVVRMQRGAFSVQVSANGYKPANASAVIKENQNNDLKIALQKSV
jgi:carboxypeptidase family protein